MPEPLVSVIVPTRNEEKVLDKCLGSIKSQTYKNIEIIVVDRDSTDRTKIIAQKYTDKVYNFGPERSAQRNYGAKKAKGDYLFFVDADMEAGKKVISQATESLDKDKSLIALIIPEESFGQNYWAKVRSLERSCYLGETTIEAPRFFRKDVFLKAGGYDENLISGEDWGLANKVRKLGKVGRIQARILHNEGSINLVDYLRKRYYYAQNIRNYEKRYPQTFKSKAGVGRVWILAKNWKKFLLDPIHGIGVFVLKSLEYFAYLLSTIT